MPQQPMQSAHIRAARSSHGMSRKSPQVKPLQGSEHEPGRTNGWSGGGKDGGGGSGDGCKGGAGGLIRGGFGTGGGDGSVGGDGACDGGSNGGGGDGSATQHPSHSGHSSVCRVKQRCWAKILHVTSRHVNPQEAGGGGDGGGGGGDGGGGGSGMQQPLHSMQ
eukprot:2461170-Pleurochrysis_carterae.AAC.2